MEVSSASSTSSVPVEAQIKVMKSQSKQLEAVVMTLIDGASQTPRPSASGTGGRLNVVA